MLSRLREWSRKRRLRQMERLDRRICDEIGKIDYQMRMARERNPHDDQWALRQHRKWHLEELDEIRYEKDRLRLALDEVKP